MQNKRGKNRKWRRRITKGLTHRNKPLYYYQAVCYCIILNALDREEEEEEYKGRSTKEEKTATALLDLTRLSV